LERREWFQLVLLPGQRLHITAVCERRSLVGDVRQRFPLLPFVQDCDQRQLALLLPFIDRLCLA